MNRFISGELINDLGKTGNISDQYLDGIIDAIEQQFDVPGLINKLFYGMVSETGHRFQEDATTLYDRVCQDYPGFSGDDFDRLLEALKQAGLINQIGTNNFELSSNSLAQQVLKRLESEQRVLQKVESFIADRYEINQESGYLLNEEELNYIDIYIKQLDIPSSHQDFIQKSRDAIIKAKRRRRLIVTGIYLLITSAALVAILFGLRAVRSEKLAKENEQLAQMEKLEAERQKKLADLQRDSAQAARAIAEVAQKEADSLRKLAQANALEAFRQQKIAEANAEQESFQRARAEANFKKAEEQRLLAEAQKAEIDELNRELQLSYDELEQTNRELVITTLAKDIAKNSIGMGPKQGETKALLAKSVFDIHNNSEEGNINDPTIVKALYEAVKILEGNPEFDHLEVGQGPVRNILFDKTGKAFYTTGGALPVEFRAIGKTNFPGVPEISQNYRLAVGQFDSLNSDKLKIVYQTLAQTADGQYLIMAGSNPYVKVYDRQNKKTTNILKLDNYYNPSKVRIASSYRNIRPDEFLLSIDKRLFFMAKEGTIDIIWSHKLQEEVINATAFESAEDFAFGTDKGQLYWTKSEQPFNTYFHPVSAMNFIEIDGKRHLAVGYENGLIRIFTPGSEANNPYGDRYFDLSQHSSIISALSTDPESEYLAVGSYDRKVSVWSLSRITDPQYTPVLYDDFKSWVTGLCFFPDGETLIAGDQEGKLRFISLDPEVYALRICEKLNRGFTEEEWRTYYKDRVPYEKVCGN